jgi:hypothetical protein
MEIEELLTELLLAGRLAHYQPSMDPPVGSGARPWSRRLGRMTFQLVTENLHLGVRYVPLSGLARDRTDQSVMGSADEVLVELARSGAVVALLPPPAWAVAVCAGPEPLRLAWLTPLPPVRWTPHPLVPLSS